MVRKSTPVAALYLELGTLPVKYEIEIKQLLFLKRILDEEADDPVLLSYQEMLKFGSEANWASNIFGLWQAYNLPLNDADIKHMDHRYWKSLVKSAISQIAFSKLVETCSTSRKTSHLTYPRLKTSKYLHELDVIFLAKVRILDLTSKRIMHKIYCALSVDMTRKHFNMSFHAMWDSGVIIL